MRVRVPTWAGVAIALLLGLLVWLRAPAAPLLVPDSPIYLQFLPTVPLVYPVFAHLVGEAGLVAAQIALYTGAAAFLAGTIAVRLRSPALAAVAALVLFANPQVWGMLATVMSEGLFLPLAIVWLAFVVHHSATGRMTSALSMGFSAALAVTVRPASLPILLIVPVIILLRRATGGWGYRIAVAGAALVLGGVIVTGERVAWRAYHGPSGFTLTASHMFGKAALLPDPGPPPPAGDATRQLVYRTLETRYRPVRAMLEAQRGTVAYPVLLAYYEVCAQHRCSHEMRNRMGMPLAQQNVVIGELARQRILANPVPYLRLAIDEYRSMWVIGVRSHPVFGPRYDRQIAAMGPLPLADTVAPEITLPVPVSRSIRVVRPAFIAIGIISAIIAVAAAWLALRRREPGRYVLPALAAAGATHGIAIFIALAGIGDGRYAMGIWPLTAMALVFGGAMLASLLPQRWTMRLLRYGHRSSAAEVKP